LPSSVACPLSGCSSEHELKRAKNKAATPYVNCQSWGGSTIFLRGDLGERWLNRNGGHTARENPVYSPDNPRAVKEDWGSEDEGEEEWPRALPGRPNPAPSSIPVLGRCEECGTPILVLDLEACSACKAPIEWS